MERIKLSLLVMGAVSITYLLLERIKLSLLVILGAVSITYLLLGIYFEKHGTGCEHEDIKIHRVFNGPNRTNTGSMSNAPLHLYANVDARNFYSKEKWLYFDYLIRNIEVRMINGKDSFVVLEASSNGNASNSTMTTAWGSIESDGTLIIVRLKNTEFGSDPRDMHNRPNLSSTSNDTVVISDEGRGTVSDVVDTIKSLHKMKQWYACNMYFSKAVFDNTAKSKVWKLPWTWEWGYYGWRVLTAPVHVIYEAVSLRIGMRWKMNYTTSVYPYYKINDDSNADFDEVLVKTKSRYDSIYYDRDTCVMDTKPGTQTKTMQDFTEIYYNLSHIYKLYLFREPVNEKIHKASQTLSNKILYHTFIVYSIIRNADAYCFYGRYNPLHNNTFDRTQFYFQTEIMDPYGWVSLEKNGEGITVQFSDEFTDVANKFKGVLRHPLGESAELIKESLVRGYLSDKDLYEHIDSGGHLRNVYCLTTENCQKFSEDLFNYLSLDKTWNREDHIDSIKWVASLTIIVIGIASFLLLNYFRLTYWYYRLVFSCCLLVFIVCQIPRFICFKSLTVQI